MIVTEPVPEIKIEVTNNTKELGEYLQRLVDAYEAKLVELEARIVALEP